MKEKIMQEIQEIQKLIKEQSDKGTLARFDVRDYEFRRVIEKETADIVQAYDSAPDIVAQTAIGKTWAKERTGYDYDYDASFVFQPDLSGGDVSRRRN